MEALEAGKLITAHRVKGEERHVEERDAVSLTATENGGWCVEQDWQELQGFLGLCPSRGFFTPFLSLVHLHGTFFRLR